jgi:hypothetical protein
VNSRIRIVSIGFLWEWLQGSVLLLAFFFTGHYEIGLVSAILISFFAGRKLYDVESMFRALLLSTFVALAYDLLVVIIRAQLTFVSSAGLNYEVATFLLLAPIQFLLGLLGGAAGSYLIVQNRSEN